MDNLCRKAKACPAGSRNFLTSTHNGQKMEMIALAEESVRSKNAGAALDFFMAGGGAAHERAGG